MNNKLRKEKQDIANAVQTMQLFEAIREKEYKRERIGVLRLYQIGTDASEFMHSNPNDRIKFAQESGLFPEG